MFPLLSLFVFILATLRSTFVNANYVVYPSDRANLAINALVTESLCVFVGPSNLVTYASKPRQVYEFWLVTCSSQQAQRIIRIDGVSIHYKRLIILKDYTKQQSRSKPC